MNSYFCNLLSAVSRTLNALIGGSAAYSLSARAELSAKKWPKRIINALFFWQKDHCATALRWDGRVNRLC